MVLRVVYEDDELIAVDKPEGVPCQSVDPEHPDDLPHRLKLERGLSYLGTHQRLDRDTSGVILYVLDKSANRAIAEQMEGRRVDKRYVALVEGWRGGSRRLEDQLARGRDGRAEVVGRKDRRGKRAVTHVEVRARRGSRALLDLRIETGRMHQIRAQLAAAGAPVMGDPLYGGAEAPRLMLHAQMLGLRHPRSGARLQIEAPAPALFEALLSGDVAPYSPENLRDALERARERRWGIAARDDTSAYRLVNEAGDGLPGLAVDVYDEWYVAQLYDEALPEEEILDALFSLGPRGVYVKRRPRQSNVIVDGADEAFAPSAPVRGAAAPDPLVVVEGGLPYRTRIGEGLSTGVFLDQRENRRRVRELCDGARVLNLFSYTCGFTVAAAAGGAISSTSVDASARLLERGRENLEGAGFSTEEHRLLKRDCFDALRDLAARGERFDLVILDPPTYSKTRSTRWKSGRAWRDLAALALAVVAPGGKLLACSNDRRMHQAAFRKHIHAGAKVAGVELAQLKDLPPPTDFPPAAGQESHLKSLLATRR